MSKATLLNELKGLLSSFFGLIVLDDIDTLTREEDPGMEDFFKTLVRATPSAKVLYTLRNEPKMFRDNSVSVPGLEVADEYPQFVDACVKQFKIAHPDPALMMGDLDTVSGRLPLVIELILGLKRRTSTYKEAIQLYQEHRGDNARAYLFGREYEALGSDNRARHVLAALSLFEEPVEFESLTTVLRFDAEQLSDAIGEIADIFFGEDEEAKNKFVLRAVARPFVSKIVQRLDRFSIIKMRADMLRARSIPNSQEVARLRFRADELLQSDKPADALRLLQAAELPPAVTEHPIFQALLGKTYSAQNPPQFESASPA
jgi:hypothetical protein